MMDTVKKQIVLKRAGVVVGGALLAALRFRTSSLHVSGSWRGGCSRRAKPYHEQ